MGGFCGGAAKGCDFKPFVTNKDLCKFWVRALPAEESGHALHNPQPDFRGDPEPGGRFKCQKGLDCPTLGQRPERQDQESDSEE